MDEGMEYNRENCIAWFDKYYPTVDTRSERYTLKRSPEMLAWMKDYTKFLDPGARFKDILAAVILGLTEQPKCPCCGISINASSGLYWKKYCSNLCAGEVGRKILREEYHTNEQWCKDQGDRVMAGVLEKNGVTNPMYIEGIQDKIIAANREKYGADYHMQTDAGQAKMSAGVRRMMKTEVGTKLLEDRSIKLKEEFQRATDAGDSTYMDKGKIGGKSKSEELLRSCVEEILGYSPPSKYIKTKRGSREIDIYIKELNIGIEYNGLYSHSEEGGKDKEYHLDKLEGARALGMHLITVWDDDFFNKEKKPIIIRRLKALLGKPDNKYYARKCSKSIIKVDEYKEFLKEYHIQGCVDGSSHRLGLRFNNKLVAVMGFKRCASNVKKYGPGKHWELCRFASKDLVVGGFSKLLKYFKTIVEYDTIYSFADCMIADNISNVYLTNGFVQHSILKPDYCYLHNRIRAHKFGFRKSYFKSEGYDIEGKTEDDLRKEAKLPRIWDAGKICYMLKR